MTEHENQLASRLDSYSKNEALKARFMADPKQVLAEYHMPVPDNMDVKVVENVDNDACITTPASPVEHLGLSGGESRDAEGDRNHPDGHRLVSAAA